MSNPSIKPINLEQATRAVVLAFAANVPVALWGAPGTGKSAIMQQIANRLGYTLYDVRLSDKEPSDIGGIPYPVEVDGQCRRVRYLMPEGLPYGTDEKAIVLLDEFDRADLSVQNVALQLLLDRAVNGHRLSDNARLALCGNSTTDIGTTPLSEAAATRICHLYVEAESAGSVASWDKWAESAGVSDEMRGFVHFSPRKSEFEPVEMAKRNARTEKAADDIFREAKAMGFPCSDILQPLIAGCIGVGAANEFLAYTETHAKMPSIAEILDDPEGAEIPQQKDVLHALSVQLTNFVKSGGPTSASAGLLCAYVSRWSSEPAMAAMRAMANVAPDEELKAQILCSANGLNKEKKKQSRKDQKGIDPFTATEGETWASASSPARDLSLDGMRAIIEKERALARRF